MLLTGLSPCPRVQQLLAGSPMPLVSMMDLAGADEQPSVGFPSLPPATTMTRYLISQGYRRIGFMGAQLDERTLRRADGYRQAMQDAGLAALELEVMVAQPSTIALGAALLDRMLEQAPDCDAIFCCNDDLAQGAVFQASGAT
jgi:LacI family gluconate utilization system Gnt-I transcriptional repressor